MPGTLARGASRGRRFRRALELSLVLVVAGAAGAESVDELIVRGGEHLAKHRYEKAAEAFAAADRQARGRSFTALDGLAQSLLPLGRYDELLAVGERIVAMSPAMVRAHGYNYLGLAHYHRAERRQMDAIHASGRGEGDREAAEAPVRNEREEAAEAFRQALALGGDRYNETRTSLAATFTDLGEADAAAAVLAEYAARGGRSEEADRLTCWLRHQALVEEEKETTAGGPPDLTPPRKLEAPSPRCPVGSSSRQTVIAVSLAVDEEGRVPCARVRVSAPGWSEAVLAAVTRWRFEPARRGGRPVPIFYDEEMGILCK